MPAIDFSRIAFPSDRLTVGMLRGEQPECFDIAEGRDGAGADRIPVGRASVSELLDGLLTAERLLAARAFKEAFGEKLTAEEGARSREELVRALASEYTCLGLASGPFHARELLGGIEAQAAAQAYLQGGRVYGSGFART